MASKVVNYEMIKPNRKVISFFCLGSISLIISLSIGISVGAVSVHTSTVWGIILNKFSPDLIEQTWSKGKEAIVWDIRFPRTIFAILVGSIPKTEKFFFVKENSIPKLGKHWASGIGSFNKQHILNLQQD